MTTDLLHRPPPGRPHPTHTSVTLGDLTTSTGGTVGADELTPSEVAAEFNVSPATVRRWEKAGVLAPTRRLPGSKHRRYSRAAVDALKKTLDTEQANPDAPAS
ncbi:helix-turn-helix domain-containing protein [Micromonospora haikouensis]|uniref:helix-turn-helix domain-containing protein n=1 Tax=Micromonospora haikouensis TaxID=686309 RepID=UPI00341BC45B